jgi:hypothetical protein
VIGPRKAGSVLSVSAGSQRVTRCGERMGDGLGQWAVRKLTTVRGFRPEIGRFVRHAES